MQDPRTPIFDAAKAAGGRFPTQTEVQLFHGVLDKLGVRRADAPAAKPKKTLIGLIGAGAAAALTATLVLWEGNAPVGYVDIAGVPTACFGDTNNVLVGKRYSDAECRQRLEDQAIKHVEPVLACTPSLRGHDDQLVAAASLAYNIGTGAYCKSTVDRRFDAGDWKGACDAFLMWNRAGGKVVRGLQNRRQYERNICLKNLPAKG